MSLVSTIRCKVKPLIVIIISDRIEADLVSTIVFSVLSDIVVQLGSNIENHLFKGMFSHFKNMEKTHGVYS